MNELQLAAETNFPPAIERVTVRVGRSATEVTSFVTSVVAYEVDLQHALSAEDYPVLAAIWDNDDDAIFDAV